jgi:putative peptidoglycan lipid II flippase
VLFAPTLVKNLLAPGFDAPTAALTATLTRIMLLQPLVLLLASVAAGVLTSRNQFLLIGLSAVSHNACLVISVLLVIAFPGIGVYGPTLGVFAGATLQILILSPGLHGAGGRVGLAWPLADARLRQVVRLLVPNSLSAAVNYSGFIVDTSFASRAPEQAAMAAIYNGFQLVTLPISLIGRAVGMAAFPRMAAQADAMAYRALRNTLLRTLGAAIALALPACGALFLLGRPTIRILFEHGQFNVSAGDLTYQVMVIYTMGLPAYVATEVTTRGLLSLRDARTPLLTNIGQLLLRAALVGVLLEPLGALAIPLALALSSTLEAILLTAILLARLARCTKA